MTSELKRRFNNNITTLYRRLLIDVSFATLLQRRDMVERLREVKTITLQRRYDVVFLLGLGSSRHYGTLRHSGTQGTWALAHLRHFIQQSPGYSIHRHFDNVC